MDSFDWLELERIEAPASEGRGPRRAPHDGPSFYLAARRMREAGHFGAAAAYYERALGFTPTDYGAWSELIDTQVRAGKLEAAEAASAYALDTYRQARALYASRALVLARTGRTAEALPMSDVSMEGEERKWYPNCVRAEVLLCISAGHRREALECLDTAVNLAPGAWEPHFIGGCILMDAGWPAFAAGYFSEAGHRNPRAAAGWICLGDCFRALRLFDQAMFYYQKVVELEPSHELALQRQKDCAGGVFGLTRVFRRTDLRGRWNREFEKLQSTWEPTTDDF